MTFWTGTRSELDSFLDGLNKAHRTLRFTWSISNERIEFLDLNIFKGEVQHHKPPIYMYKHTLQNHQHLSVPTLLFPPQECLFKGLVKGEAIRFLRSNTDARTYYNSGGSCWHIKCTEKFCLATPSLLWGHASLTNWSLSNRPLHMLLRPGEQVVLYPAADQPGEGPSPHVLQCL